MSCFPELTYSIYTDGELDAEQSRQVEVHLGACARCRDLVESLQCEARLIGEVLIAESQVAAPVPRRQGRGLLGIAAALIAVSIMLRTAFDWASAWRLPAGVDWLHPFNWDVPLSLFFYVLNRLTQEGTAMSASMVSGAGGISLVLLAALFAALLLRRRPKVAIMLVGVLLALGLASPASAIETRKADTVTVQQGETVDDSLMAMAEIVTIDGTITGNLFVFAKSVTIRGTVKGDVVSFCQSLQVEGTIGGNVFNFSQWSLSRGHVMGSAVQFGQSIILDSASRVDGDMVSFGSQMTPDGTIGRDTIIFGESADVRASIGRNLLMFGRRIRLLPTAHVGGNFDASVKDKTQVRVEPGATVTGKSETHLSAPASSAYKRPFFYLWRAIGVVAALIIGLLLASLFGAASYSLVAPRTAGQLLQRLGVGFLVLVATPIAAVIVAITLIGLPLAFISVGLWLIALYLAKVFVAAWIGEGLVHSGTQVRSLALPLLVGLVIIYVAINLPYIGGILHFLVILVGLGMVFLRVRESWRRPVPAA